MPHTWALLRPEHVSILQSNTTFHSLSGHHILRQKVKVECIKNLTLIRNETFVPGLLDLPAPLQSDLLQWLCCVLFCCYAYTFHWQPPFSGCGALMVNYSPTNFYQLWAALAVGDMGNRSIYDITIQAITV